MDFYQSVNYDKTWRDATGLFTIKMEPEKTGLACIGERKMVGGIMFYCTLLQSTTQKLVLCVVKTLNFEIASSRASFDFLNSDRNFLGVE